MSIEILDPTHEASLPGFVLATRLETLKGKTIGIISNGKKGTRPFFDAFERELIGGFGVSKVVRRTKLNYSAPAEPEILHEALHWDALIAGIGD